MEIATSPMEIARSLTAMKAIKLPTTTKLSLMDMMIDNHNIINEGHKNIYNDDHVNCIFINEGTNCHIIE